MTALKMLIAGVPLAAAGIIATVFGPGLAEADDSVSEDQIMEFAARNVPESCWALRGLPTEQGVNAEIANVQGQGGFSRRVAGRVVAYSVQFACPEYLPLVQTVVPDFP